MRPPHRASVHSISRFIWGGGMTTVTRTVDRDRGYLPFRRILRRRRGSSSDCGFAGRGCVSCPVPVSLGLKLLRGLPVDSSNALSGQSESQARRVAPTRGSLPRRGRWRSRRWRSHGLRLWSQWRAAVHRVPCGRRVQGRLRVSQVLSLESTTSCVIEWTLRHALGFSSGMNCRRRPSLVCRA